MENTSSAASVSFVALARIAGDHNATAAGRSVQGTGLSRMSRWNGVTPAVVGSPAVRRVHLAPENNYIDVPTANVVALAKQGAPPRGEPR